jgi:lipid A oxidase
MRTLAMNTPARAAAASATRARHHAALVLGCAAALLGAPAAARGELVLTLLLGNAWVAESDLRVARGNTALTLESTGWETRSFQDPPYYDVRLTRWSPRRPAWGIGLDLTHAKAYLDEGEVVFARGQLAGRPVAAPLPVREAVQQLNFSHGLNTVTIDVYRRWLAPRRQYRESRVALYLGAGAGLAVPHVEATVGGVPTSEYQLAGPALRATVGLDVPIDDNISLVGEGTLSWVDLDVDLAGGGALAAELLVPQLTFGLSLRD